MLLRKIADTFTATHATALLMTAIIVPGALYGAVSYQPVSIVDPNTGSKAFVTAGRALYATDPIAGYRNNPANTVDIYVHNNNTGCANDYAYTVPSGKALVVVSETGYIYDEGLASNSTAISGYEVFDGAGCNGNVLTTNYASVSAAMPLVQSNQDFGVGIIFKAGSALSVYSGSNYGDLFFHGYLIPATAAPALEAAAGRRATNSAMLRLPRINSQH